MKIDVDSWKTDYETSTGGTSTAYIDVSIDYAGKEFRVGTDKHSDEFLLLKYEGDTLKEVYSEGIR